MQNVETSFVSDELRLDARFYLPDAVDPDVGMPLVVACSGFLGLYKIHPARFARVLTEHGIACFSFDYQGFGESGGERGRILIDEQVRDLRCAITFARNSTDYKFSLVFGLGWALGAGLLIDCAFGLQPLDGIIAVNGLYDGFKFQEYHRSRSELQQFLRRVELERLGRSRGEAAQIVDPFDIYPLDGETMRYVRGSLDTVEGYNSKECRFEFADSFIRWSASSSARRLRVPLLVLHGERNFLHPLSQASDIVKEYAGEAELVVIPDIGHTEWMNDENAHFRDAATRIVQWIKEKS